MDDPCDIRPDWLRPGFLGMPTDEPEDTTPPDDIPYGERLTPGSLLGGAAEECDYFGVLKADR